MTPSSPSVDQPAAQGSHFQLAVELSVLIGQGEQLDAAGAPKEWASHGSHGKRLSCETQPSSQRTGVAAELFTEVMFLSIKK
jgi:hypothetical protein